MPNHPAIRFTVRHIGRSTIQETTMPDTTPHDRRSPLEHERDEAVTLLPCPFCGGVAAYITPEGKAPYVMCDRNHCTQPSHDCVNAWNTRATQEQPPLPIAPDEILAARCEMAMRQRDDVIARMRVLEAEVERNAAIAFNAIQRATLAEELRDHDKTRAETAEAEVEELRAATNQCRLAFAGYVSARSAIDMLDALPAAPKGALT